MDNAAAPSWYFIQQRDGGWRAKVGSAMNARFSPPRSRILAGIAATFAALPRAASAQMLVPIRLAGVPTDDMTPVFYAIKSGLYKRAGLDVEVIPTSSGAVATEAVVAGTYEMGKGSLIASLLAHLKGLPLTIVGNGNVYNPKAPNTLMVVPADSAVKTGADLNGMTLAGNAVGDFNTLAMDAWIDATGGDSKTIKWVEIPNSAAGAALAQHRIAAAILQEPELSATLETEKVRILAPAYSAISDRFAITVYFARPDWVEKNTDSIKKWARVTYEAAAYTNAHRAETAAMMADATKIPLETILKVTRATAATSGDPSLIQPCIDLAAKYKYIPHAFTAKDVYFTG
jgi:NitT/TauT family transport system substrate-binding protein